MYYTNGFDLPSNLSFTNNSQYFFIFFPTVPTQYPPHQNILFPYLYFKFACLSKIMRELFSFKYPTISDTLYCVVYQSVCAPVSFLLLFFHIIV